MKTKTNDSNSGKAKQATTSHNDNELLNDPTVARLQDIWSSYSHRIDDTLSDARPAYSTHQLPVIEPFSFRLRHFAAIIALVLMTIYTSTSYASHSRYDKILKNNSIDVEKTVNDIQWTIENI